MDTSKFHSNKQEFQKEVTLDSIPELEIDFSASRDNRKISSATHGYIKSTYKIKNLEVKRIYGASFALKSRDEGGLDIKVYTTVGSEQWILTFGSDSVNFDITQLKDNYVWLVETAALGFFKRKFSLMAPPSVNLTRADIEGALAWAKKEMSI